VLGSWAGELARCYDADETGSSARLSVAAFTCERCGESLGPMAGVPVLGWILVKGKCPRCGHPWWASRFFGEVLGAASIGLAAWRLGPVIPLAAYAVAFAGLVAMTIVDLRIRLIPRRLVWPTLLSFSLLAILAELLDGDPRALASSALGGASAFVVILAIHLAYPRGMGYGDVRLAGLVGAAIGLRGLAGVPAGFFVAFAAGALVGLAIMAATKGAAGRAIPFGPFLALGCVVGSLWGEQIARSWVHLLGH